MAGKVTYPTADSARAAATAAGSKTTAYQSMNQSSFGSNIYSASNPAVQPYLAYLEASDDAAKAIAWQNLMRSWVSSKSMVPAGSSYKNNFVYLQTILRKLGLSKGNTAIGVLDPKGQDQAAFKTILQRAVSQNLPFTDYIKLLAEGGTGATGTTVKQVDTTTKYNKQIATALQLKDEAEAKKLFTDSYFKMYGLNPSDALGTSFAQAWNAEAKKQLATTTTDYVTTYEKVYDTTKPVIDPKTKKPKLDANGKPIYQQKSVNGVLQWKPITKQNTVTNNEGFTADEQNQFLAEYLVSNFPEDNFDPKTLGGAARSIYDGLSKLHRDNFSDVPDFSTLAGTIKSMLSTADSAVSKEVYDAYARKVRDNIATKYMSLADWVNDGNDAAEKVNPLLTAMSQFLESDVNIKDPVTLKVLNFQGSDGKYRLPNEYELNQILLNDSRYARTSTARNESVNVAQTLSSRLRIS